MLWQKALKVLQPLKLKDPEFIEELKVTTGRLAGGRCLSNAARNGLGYACKRNDQPPCLFVPQYRGAAPINHAIINGEKESGVTTFFLKHEIDTGDVIFSEKCKHCRQ